MTLNVVEMNAKRPNFQDITAWLRRTADEIDSDEGSLLRTVYLVYVDANDDVRVQVLGENLERLRAIGAFQTAATKVAMGKYA